MATGVVVEPATKWTARWRLALRVLRESLLKFYTDDSLSVAASIAYYSVLSIFPFLLLLLELTGVFISHYQLAGRLSVVLEPILPTKPDFILQNLQSISRAYGRVGVASFLLLLWSSAGVFLPIEKALNRAWEVEEERSWPRRRLLALEMSLIFGAVLLISSTFVGLDAYLRFWVQSSAAAPGGFLWALGYRLLIMVSSFALTLAMFIVIYGRLPNRRMALRQALPSALVTAVVWQAARSAFTHLLPRFNYRHVYGSIGALVALMTWAYISSAVMLFGARVSGVLYRTLKNTPSP
ncbi:MAG TPA: YihY/virulence factor BrkB family protein [Terriglobia bacterium]|nr:YihY/virulence factor BrkB family protein [Terriglobia bacterium]